MTKIYLAGAMEYYRDKNYNNATGWRIDIRNGLVSYNDNYKTNFTFFDPCINEDDRHNIISQNTYYLDKSDLVIVNLKDIDKSLGSIYELVYAYIKQKPIISFNSHEWLLHPHMKHMISVNLKDYKSVIEFVGRVYGQ